MNQRRRKTQPLPPSQKPSYLTPLSLIMPVLTTLALAVINAGAQHLPPELTFPRVNEYGEGEAGAAADSGVAGPRDVYFSTDQTVFDRSYTGINNFVYSHAFDDIFVEQSLWYELRRDRLANTRHYLNASGSLAYPLARYPWLTPGLDWTPVAQYSGDRGGHNALSTIDIGPTAGFSVGGVPVNLRAGLSGRRVDSLAGPFTVGDNRSSVGAYGAFQAGSWDEPLPFAPIYFYADGLGRQIENSGMASLTSSALGAMQIGERDSLFVYGDVSLFNGREGYLEGSADSRAAHLTETPWRVERNANATVGLKGAQRYMVVPSLYYSVGENTLEFLNDSRRRDERTVRQTLSGAVSTDSTAGLYYSGMIAFEWREHDKLFRQKLPAALTPDNISDLEVNLWDYSSFEPRTIHRIAFRVSESFKLKYDLSLTRVLTEYPNFYFNGQDTVTNKDDNDRRTQAQRLALEYRSDTVFRAELFGEWIDYDLVFLKQAKSSSNRTDNTQRVGIILEWAPSDGLQITEALSAEAKTGTFHFPAYHQKALQRPRYSRAVNSSLSAAWQVTPLAGLSGKWNIKFSDYGFWYGREYMQEVLEENPEARTDYYAITSKSVYYTADAAVRLTPGETVLEAGNAITVARDRNYSGGDYILINEDGYSLKPYINAAVKIGSRVELSAYLSRTFVIGNDALGYWDLRLQAEGAF